MIANHEGKRQICCDSCPASLALVYPESFEAMVARAKAAGWRFQKVQPRSGKGTSDLFGSTPRVADAVQQPFTHTCPGCTKPQNHGSLF